MQITSPSPSTMGPPTHSSPETEQAVNTTNGNGNNATQMTQGQSVGAVAASQGPKVVQTAFIHKLYNMLEDQSIQHLISWSNTNESFVMSPSSDFSKVLAQYFKHTNISSFVRQLNMYGFHKVSDVFHTGSPESALWEFKHGNNNFKKGDLTGLREIKRRASRHALIHRESFSGKAGQSQPGTPSEILPDNDTRLANAEFALQDIHNRLLRTEESYALMSSRCQALTEGMVKVHEWSRDLSQSLQSFVPTQSPLYHDIIAMQKEISRHLEQVRALEYPHETLLSGRQPFFSNMSLDAPPSPRGFSFDDSRRSSVQFSEPPPRFNSRPPVPPIPSRYTTSPRRFGSVSGGPPQSDHVFSRPPLPTHQPNHVHPLSAVVPASAASQANPLARRHTSADIREHGWPIPPNLATHEDTSPYSSSQQPQWGSSSPSHHQSTTISQHVGVRHTTSTNTGTEQSLRDQLDSYSLNGPRRQSAVSTLRGSPPPPLPSSLHQQHHQQISPPPIATSNLNLGLGLDTGVSKFARTHFELHSAPTTRRGSVASNVHHLLNPADTAEGDEDGSASGYGGAVEERKRKRLS